MKDFNYYLFGNYDANEVRNNSDDPRFMLNADVDCILSEIIESAPGMCRYDFLCNRYTQQLVNNILRVGLLRMEDQSIFLDTPVFVAKDYYFLNHQFSEGISHIANNILHRKNSYYHTVSQIDNGFPAEINLYHILCGAILDGTFFDYISDKGVVSTSRIHSSGLDYLIIAYEKSAVLNSFSNKLLCSYNRFSDGKRALQSFGDSDGNRIDPFRLMSQIKLGKVPESLTEIENLWKSVGKDNMKEMLLSEMQRFVDTGCCDKTCYRLLTMFGYVKDEKTAVPVYRKKHIPTIDALEKLTEECIFDDVNELLSSTKICSDLVCGRHGVSVKEIANELYHIVFGKLNELLILQGFVAEPESFPGEGRYLKSIEIM